jgi:hypothetical protein
VPKQIHQDVDADLGVGELGGERVTQPVHQRRAGSLAVDAGFLDGAQDAVLQGSAQSPRTRIDKRVVRPSGHVHATGEAMARTMQIPAHRTILGEWRWDAHDCPSAQDFQVCVLRRITQSQCAVPTRVGTEQRRSTTPPAVSLAVAAATASAATQLCGNDAARLPTRFSGCSESAT